MDKVVVYTVILIVLAGFVFWGIQSGFFTNGIQSNVAPAALPSGIVLFYSPNCPHCQDVEKFISDNNIDAKVKITKLEIPFAGKTSPELQANAALAINLAQQCKTDVSGGLGIPFLYDPSTGSGQAGKCYVGEVDIPAFLKTQAGIK